MIKSCLVCLVEKPIESFPTRKLKNCIAHRGECKDCTFEYRKKYRAENKDRIAQLKKEWVFENRDLKRSANYRWFLTHKEEARKSVRNHRINNKLIYRAKRAARRAKQACATPKWVDMQKIKDIYLNCPPGYHVDHIIPLTHPDVCGLHVPWNLQYLPAIENLKKSNKI